MKNFFTIILTALLFSCNYLGLKDNKPELKRGTEKQMVGPKQLLEDEVDCFMVDNSGGMCMCAEKKENKEVYFFLDCKSLKMLIESGAIRLKPDGKSI